MSPGITGTPARGLVWVRKVETAETLPGGVVILPQEVRDGLTSCQAEVVAVGAPVVCEDEDCERLHTPDPVVWKRQTHWPHVEPGQWVVVTHRALGETDQEGVYCCTQDDVLARLEL